MLTTVKILNPALQRRCGKTEVSFEPGVNLLVGPNGSGKSTVMDAIRGAHSGRVSVSQVQVAVRDPRFPLELFYHSADGVVRGESVTEGSNLGSLQSRMESHGQTLSRYLLGIENQVTPAVFLVDEPEVALDLENLVYFGSMIQSKVDEGHQFIIATHHPLFMKMPDINVLTFGKDKKYMANTMKTYRNLFRAA